jgi:hypothetical protein
MIAGMAFGAVLAGCSMIDEDQDDCGIQAEINYELQLMTTLTAELHLQLETETEGQLFYALRDYLKNIFSDFAHDVDLSFYDVVGDSTRLRHEKHIVDANQVSYTLNLPMRDYMHLAAANLVDNHLVGLVNDGLCHPSMLQQVAGDTIDSHDTGLFTARLPMQVLNGVNQNFDVRLYMANCAVCLIIDTQGHDASQIKVYSTGFATDFNICDSVFKYSSRPPVVRTQMLNPGGGEIAFCSVNFPSRDPSVPKCDEESLWEFRVYASPSKTIGTRAETSITETILSVSEPINAGKLKIIRCKLLDDGSVVTKAPKVGVSVTLDWKEGSVYHPEL